MVILTSEMVPPLGIFRIDVIVGVPEAVIVIGVLAEAVV